MIDGVCLNVCDVLRRGTRWVLVDGDRLVLKIFFIEGSSHEAYLELVLFDQGKPRGFVRNHFRAEVSDVPSRVYET